MTVQRARDISSDKPRFLSFTRSLTILPFAIDRILEVGDGAS